MNAADNLVYVSRYSGNDIGIIDGATDELVGSYMLPEDCLPSGVDFDAGRQLLYVACSGTGTVAAIDVTVPHDPPVVESDRAGTELAALVVNPATGKVYVADRTDSRIAVLDWVGGNLTVVTMLEIPAWDLAVNEETNLIYATSGDSLVQQIDGHTNEVLHPIEIPPAYGYPAHTRGVAVNDVTNLIYVTSLQVEPGIDPYSLLYVVGGESHEVIGTGDSSMTGEARSAAFNLRSTRIYTPSSDEDRFDGISVWDDPDDDRDGQPDATDNCPLVRNEDQADSDGDGIGDACETVADSDGDGIPDESDNCIDISNPQQVDSDSDGVGDMCDDCMTYRSEDTPKPINDFYYAPSTITVPHSFNVSDISVMLNAEHPYDGELETYLYSPTMGVLLFRNVGGDGDNFTNTVFDDQCATPISSGVAPFSGCYHSPGALSSLFNQDSSGPWTLDIFDGWWGNQGTLQSWQIELCGYSHDDTDADGVPDALDNCPEVSNTDQADMDGDDLGDACDPDKDGDGVNNNVDVCPAVSDPTQTDTDNDGVGDACEYCIIRTSSDTPIDIPDLSTVLSTITVPNSFSVADVNVTLNIGHSWDSDLDVFLVSPTAARVELFTDVGGAGHSFSGTVLDDQCATAITAGGAAIHRLLPSRRATVSARRSELLWPVVAGGYR